MPGSRIFTHFDVSGIVEGYAPGDPVLTNCSNNLVNSNFGTFSVNGSGNDSSGGPGVNVNASLNYGKTGTINFQSGVRPIPNDALITRVRTRVNSTISAQANASTDGVIDCIISLDTHAPDPENRIAIQESYDDQPTVSHHWNKQVLGSDADVIYDFSETPLTYTELVAQFGSFSIAISHSISAGTNLGVAANSASVSYNLGISNWELEVTWTNRYVWNLPQPDNVDTGSVITLTSPTGELGPDEEAIDFSQVTDIDIIFDFPPGTPIIVPVTAITVINNFWLTFIFPSLLPSTPSVVTVVLTSTQFTGTVSKQLYTILFVSASGIYTLIPDKVNDTLYVEDDPGETIDVKIPDPFGKTGLI